MLLFASKKIYSTACLMYRTLWENGAKVEFERQSYYNNYVRLWGFINGVQYQVHINSDEIAGRFRDLKAHRDNDSNLLRLFAVACACGDYGQYFRKFEHLAKTLVLNV